MAAKSDASAEKPKDDPANLPATTGGAGLPSYLEGMIDDDAGKGLSQAAEDNVIPLLYILQSNSPQVDSRSPDYVKGSKPGDFWVKGSDKSHDGEAGILVQPCAFAKDYVEWVPRSAGGGFVGKHERLPPDAKEKKDAEGRLRMTRENGNEVNETRYHFVTLDGSPVVIPLTSTGHTASREWMNRMNSTRLPNSRKSAPSFATLWRLTTRQRSNKSGKWFALGAEHEGWVATAEDYEFGRSIYEQVESGAVRAANEDQQGGTPAHDPETGEIHGSGDKNGDVPF